MPSAPERRRRIAVVCGNIYGFRGIYAAAVQQLSRLGDVTVYVLNYPVGEEIASVLAELQASGVIYGWHLIPGDRTSWRHHVALARITRQLRRIGVDLLVLDGDFMPMHRYFIHAARACGAAAVALQKEVPKQLLRAAAVEQRGHPEWGGPPPLVSARRLRRALERMVERDGRRTLVRQILREIQSRCDRRWREWLHYWFLPLVMTGRFWTRWSYERQGVLFASRRVDLALVYSEAVREALQHIAPSLPVVVVQHPLAVRCRCNGSPAPSRLLVALTGPWRNYTTVDRPPEWMIQRWCELILRLVTLGGFSRVDIRPHPREDGSYPAELAQRLVQRGVGAYVAERPLEPLHGIVCNYAGVVGPATGALSEAAATCRRAFVLCVQGLQGSRAEIQPSALTAEARVLGAGEELEAVHLTRPDGTARQIPTIDQVLDLWLARRSVAEVNSFRPL